MKGLKSLIRLHKWGLEEERKALARLLATRQTIENQIQRIRADLDDARRNANTVQWLFAYPPYADVAHARIERLTESLVELDSHIFEAEERVSTAYKELRKFEIALENQEERERQAAERRDQAVLDEVALNAHLRKTA